jgi:hypothetical protein
MMNIRTLSQSADPQEPTFRSRAFFIHFVRFLAGRWFPPQRTRRIYEPRGSVQPIDAAERNTSNEEHACYHAGDKRVPPDRCVLGCAEQRPVARDHPRVCFMHLYSANRGARYRRVFALSEYLRPRFLGVDEAVAVRQIGQLHLHVNAFVRHPSRCAFWNASFTLTPANSRPLPQLSQASETAYLIRYAMSSPDYPPDQYDFRIHQRERRIAPNERSRIAHSLPHARVEVMGAVTCCELNIDSQTFEGERVNAWSPQPRLASQQAIRR